jgi:serine protease Do
MSTWRQSTAVLVLSAGAATAGFFGGNALFQRLEFARAEQSVDDSRHQLATADDLSTVFRHVGKVLEPSVVSIQVTKSVPAAQMPEDPLRRFFHNQAPDGGGDDNNGNGNGDDQGNGDQDQGPDAPQEEIGTGSGVIMEVGDGYAYVLTNNHVAGDAQTITVTLSDGRIIKNKDCKVVGADPKSDLAVVKIQADRLIPAQWGDSALLEKGDWIMAFGAPFGYVGSMTHGIVSALDRHDIGLLDRQQGYEDFIQVDAPINPGNSGGPLVNIHGEVVGINTAIASRSGGFQGIGFAIPSDEAHFVYDQLKEHGKVIRGWLGVGIDNVSANVNLAQSFGYNGTAGVLVEETFANTPASGKLQRGDIITKYNGNAVDDVQQLRNAVATTAPGADVNLTVFRDGKEVAVTITIGTQPDDLLAATGHQPGDSGQANPEANTADALGMKLSTLTDDLSQKYGLDGIKQGALVTGVKRDSLAFKAGLQPGDVITSVGNTDVATAADAADALKKGDTSKGIRLYVTNKDGSRFVFLQNDQDQ